eukprot:UN21797
MKGLHHGTTEQHKIDSGSGDAGWFCNKRIGDDPADETGLVTTEAPETPAPVTTTIPVLEGFEYEGPGT